MDSLTDQVSRFLFHEADLMDEHRFEEWLAVWAPEITYWVPCNADDIDPNRQVSIIYDDRTGLENRIARLQSPSAHSQIPKSKLRRLISNVVADDIANGDIEASCNFIVAESRHHRQVMFAGKARYLFENGADGLLIKQKKVLLIDNDDYINNLSFII
ncbi:MAG: aromatic-ring-hydroxylating dioxygenase subunit beta [Immundisolibacteraceae bacterium]|nr:aromatic-ring-hydroxylating dioxygenase subunit beta [Immundisolibacteraceae bacterium]